MLTYSSVVARDQSFCLDNTKLPGRPYTTALPFFCFGCCYIALPSTQCSEGSLWSSRWFRAVYNITRLIHGCMRFSAKVRDLAIISCQFVLLSFIVSGNLTAPSVFLFPSPFPTHNILSSCNCILSAIMCVVEKKLRPYEKNSRSPLFFKLYRIFSGICENSRDVHFLARRDPPGYSIFRVPLFHSDRGRYFLFAEWIRKVVENGLLKFVWGGWQAD